MKTTKKHIKKELQDLNADKLKMHFEESSEIPFDYFNNLNVKILDTIKQEKGITKKRSFFKVFIPFTLAASLIFIFGLPMLSDGERNINWEQFSSQDYEEYINYNIEEFTTEEIASISLLSENSFFINIELSDQELEEYLLEIDIQDEDLF